ncbi:hypothetical protein [Bradyrhizobium lablabi]|uniref:hypothetical protein n=1 Tax=Bradyrhizobium lablabi TaxID=722472 RepID=UPI001BA74EB8|nr:hypothetical protein [Bradyrhizobium lablabi]MBR0693602.1 hypothetical protein [Bradyrhizobium lablabi]
MDIATADKVIETAAKLKKIMLEKGITAAKAKCPFCDAGFVHGRLVGRKSHMHMHCDDCDISMME